MEMEVNNVYLIEHLLFHPTSQIEPILSSLVNQNLPPPLAPLEYPMTFFLDLSYSIYFISPVSSIAAFHKVSQQQYADDTKVFIALSRSNSDTSVTSIQTALISHVMVLLALNSEKSDAILLGTSKHNASLTHISSVNIAGTQIPLSSHLKLLGVTPDSNAWLQRLTPTLTSVSMSHPSAAHLISYSIALSYPECHQ